MYIWQCDKRINLFLWKMGINSIKILHFCTIWNSTYTYICMYVYGCVHIYVYIMRVYVYVYIIYLHTHIYLKQEYIGKQLWYNIVYHKNILPWQSELKFQINFFESFSHMKSFTLHTYRLSHHQRNPWLDSSINLLWISHKFCNNKNSIKS